MNVKKIFTLLTLFSLFSAPFFAADYCKNRKCDRECKDLVCATIQASAASVTLGSLASIAPTLGHCICASTLSGVCGCIAFIIPTYDVYSFYKLRREDERQDRNVPTLPTMQPTQPAQIAMSVTPAIQPRPSTPDEMPALKPGWNRMQ